MATDDGILHQKTTLEFDLTESNVDAVREVVQDQHPETELASRDYFKLYSDYTELFLTGDKSTTIRFENGMIDFPVKSELPMLVNSQENPNDTNYIGDVVINNIVVKRFGALTKEDALIDGFESRQAAITALENIYPQITQSDLVTIYSIEPGSSFSELQQNFSPTT